MPKETDEILESTEILETPPEPKPKPATKPDPKPLNIMSKPESSKPAKFENKLDLSPILDKLDALTEKITKQAEVPPILEPTPKPKSEPKILDELDPDLW